MGPGLSSSLYSGLVVVGQSKERVVGGNGHLLRIGIQGQGPAPDTLDVISESRGICSKGIWSVEPIFDSIVGLCSQDYVSLFNASTSRILARFDFEAVFRASYLSSQSLLVVVERDLRLVQLVAVDSSSPSDSTLHHAFSISHVGRLFSVFSNDSVDSRDRSTWLLVGTEDGLITVFDLASPACSEIHRIQGHQSQVKCLSMSPSDGSSILSGSWDDSVRLWDSRNWQQTARLDIGCSVNSLLWTTRFPEQFAVGTHQAAIQIFDTRKILEPLRVIETEGLGIQLTAMGERIVSSSDSTTGSYESGICQIWDWDSGRKVFERELFGKSYGLCYCEQRSD